MISKTFRIYLTSLTNKVNYNQLTQSHKLSENGQLSCNKNHVIVLNRKSKFNKYNFTCKHAVSLKYFICILTR